MFESMWGPRLQKNKRTQAGLGEQIDEEVKIMEKKANKLRREHPQ